MKIKNNVYLQHREKLEKHTKYEESNNTAKHLTKAKAKKLYDYYKCDYCGDEIKITKKWEDKTGGIIILPETLTHKTPLKLALCTKCLKKVLKEFEEVN